ncbi:MAG: GNAT family N-acetyltransferase, partial [Oligoflexia bacterium]|nr:GNAT family N-acetyltransferase [Oligoflexia bacterium]
MYERVLPNGLVIRSTAPEHATQLEELQKTVFPTLHDTQRLKKAHYLKHIQIFAAGQFVALDQNKVIGMTTTIRLAEDFLNGAHRFDEVIQGGFCTSHDPQGDWLYGVDMGTHPDYRGRGVARALYLARAATVTALKLKGQYTMGMLSGYGPLRATIAINQYYQQLLRGEIAD